MDVGEVGEDAVIPSDSAALPSVLQCLLSHDPQGRRDLEVHAVPRRHHALNREHELNRELEINRQNPVSLTSPLSQQGAQICRGGAGGVTWFAATERRRSKPLAEELSPDLFSRGGLKLEVSMTSVMNGETKSGEWV